MANIFTNYRYTSENAIDLFHLIVNELESKIIGCHMKIGNFRFPINFNDYHDTGNDKLKHLEKEIGYRCQHNEQRIARLSIEAILNEGDLPYLQINNINWSQQYFCFPFDKVIFKEQPLLCFNKWLEIAVNDMPLIQQEAEFDNFLQNQKEARDLKDRIEFLRRSLDKRPSHSGLGSILSNDHLRKEIYENGSRL